MALIAEIHPRPGAKEVVQEGVGTPFLLKVTLPIRGTMTTLEGAVFSYYEFKQPLSKRLTNEEWAKMLADPSTRPDLPHWYPAAARK